MSTLRKIAAFEIQCGASGGGPIAGLAGPDEGLTVEERMIDETQTGEGGTAPQTGVDSEANN
jgi:hypothetical protein